MKSGHSVMENFAVEIYINSIMLSHLHNVYKELFELALMYVENLTFPWYKHLNVYELFLNLEEQKHLLF